MSGLGFAADLASVRRIVALAEPGEKRKAAFRMMSREMIRWDGMLPKPDVVDGLYEIGRAGDLSDDDIQEAMADAVVDPFDPARAGLSEMAAASEGAARVAEIADYIVGGAKGKRPAERALSQQPLHPLRLDELLRLEVQPRSQILAPILPEKGLAMLYAPRGMGKTNLALGMTYAVAAGSAWLHWTAPKAIRCLYIDGEMPMAALKERVENIEGGALRKASPDHFHLLAADYHPDGLPNLSTAEGQAQLEAVLEGVELIVLDNLSTLVPAARDNDANSWNSMQGWLLRQRRQGRAVLMCHHAGKGGQQRGTSRREDVLDTVIALRHPSDYSAEDGARFEVHIEKARGAFGEDVKPFEAKMQVINGATVWTSRDLADANMAKVVSLLQEGNSIRDVAEETGIKRSTVHRMKKTAVARGDVFPKGAE